MCDETLDCTHGLETKPQWSGRNPFITVHQET